MDIFNESPAIVFLAVFLVFYIVMSWIDANSDNNFFASLLANINDSSTSQHINSSSQEDKQTIEELKERVAVLEKIISDSRFELDQKLNRL